MSPNDEIRIEELEVFARVGVPAGERAHPQRLIVSLTLVPRFGFDQMHDELARTVDYAAIAAELRRFAASRSDCLIETLADEIAQHLLRQFDLARVDLELRKFVLPGAKFVAVRLTRLA